MKVLLDTNFLIDIARFKIDLEEIKDLIQSPYTLVTLDKVVQELKTLAGRRARDSKYAKVALKIIDEYKIEILKAGITTDEALVQLASENYIVATNDIALRKRLKTLGRKTIYLKSKKHLAIG